MCVCVASPRDGREGEAGGSGARHEGERILEEKAREEEKTTVSV